ncbi:poly(A) RNA polymerase, mitochondrial-like isoform X1 [Acropora palmata]|uniref:poly(A) RNA polymerase, mitochondrial-like isoform X1 n=2 Tax=Acropora palmata TaxID=6131 RepID=UPI003DA1781B
MAVAKGNVWCDVCGVSLPSAALLPTHNKGKKHQRFLNLRKERELACKKSIYVRGFQNSGMIEDELTDYFNAYGEVSKVFLDKDKGVFAIVEMTDEESVSSILQQKTLPLLGGKRLIVKERSVNKDSLCSALPRPKINKPRKDSRPHPYTQQWQNAQMAAFVSEELAKKLRSSVYKIDEQINLLMEEFCLTEEDVKLRGLVCQLLKEVFLEVYSSASVVPFGSTVSGAGWKGSDLDICLLTDDPSDAVDLDFSVVIDTLRSFAPGCVNIIPVLSAKCPLIKFKHQPSDLACDLSINNRLGVANSELLRCYMSLDPRIPQLIFIVKAWAKAKGLSVYRQLSNYALTVLVLYFLQIQVPPVIPSLQQGFSAWIKKETDEHYASCIYLEPQPIDSWDCSFFKDFSRLMPSINAKSVGQLLEEFFLFFSTEFDSSKFVVSIRTGRTTTISTILEELRVVKSVNTEDHLPDFGEKNNKETCSSSESDLMSVENFKERVPGALKNCSSNADSGTKHGKQVQFKVSALIVQDPFELTHNLTQNIPESSYKCIMDLMKDAYKICKNLNNMSGNANHQTTLLELLTVHKTAKKRKGTNSHSFFVAHQQSEDEVLCPMGLSSTADVFHFILGNLEREFGIKCERRSSAKKQRSENNDSEALSQVTQLHVMPQDSWDPALQIQECTADVGKSQNDEQTGERNGGDIDKIAEDFSAICTAFENTWTHSRKERHIFIDCQ